ncbi:MAG: HAD-IIB family hydrolase [Desulfobulbaceae bacterium]|nr:HAD-IIB family hydrolase [Desulfobulbaceae bacterium]HIJ79872.1 HAD-IIB family hydrolase [Deltaproteobacteria bacterium]
MATTGLYLQLFSIHGLVRGHGLEMGRDADTGGQVKYVIELARALAEHPAVDQVDLITRLIYDKTVSNDYAQPIEPLSEKARIVRIQCGGRKYMRKELLWPHLDEMVDKTLKFIKNSGRIPDIFHGHYADGGYVASELASIFGVPLIFTGHSMGAHKRNKLLAEGHSPEEINRRYNIDHRIRVEDRVIKDAEQIIVSTNHEIDKQYGLYKNFTAGRYAVNPPGIDVETFYPYYAPQLDAEAGDEATRQARVVLLSELHRFWVNPQKPFVLALCRPDQRKNISGLITAYGEDKDLQAIANLAIFAGIRKDIAEMEENERNVLTEMLLLMDRYDLYGKLAIPKKHDFSIEVPELYRLCADSHGVFVNPALVEPFGLTLIEAASCGLPIIATMDGGPTDIIGNCENGILIDPTNSSAIAAACRKILVDKELWEFYSGNGINGVRKHYSWPSHCKRTVELIKKVRAEMPASLEAPATSKPRAFGSRLTRAKRLLITDIDNTLVGDPDALAALLGVLKENRANICWGVATGRCLEKTLKALQEYKVPKPDIIICSVGTEIYYGPSFTLDKGWQQHITYRWRPEQLKSELGRLDFLTLQEEIAQRRAKISYYVDLKADPDLIAKVHQALEQKKLRYNLVHSLGQYLDILPYRASKGKAIRYLSYKWEIPLPNIMVCGDSGKDEEMLRGDTKGVVVGNYVEELERLRSYKRIYFSEQNYAAGILDGIAHYRFLEEGAG